MTRSTSASLDNPERATIPAQVRAGTLVAAASESGASIIERLASRALLGVGRRDSGKSLGRGMTAHPHLASDVADTLTARLAGDERPGSWV